jgi:hypothetical protein
MNQRLNFAKAALEAYKHLSALDQHIGEHIEHSLFELVKCEPRSSMGVRSASTCTAPTH